MSATIGSFRFGLKNPEDFARYQESLCREAREVFGDCEESILIVDAVDQIIDHLFGYTSISDIEPSELVTLLRDAFDV